jgi:hypothetical protein
MGGVMNRDDIIRMMRSVCDTDKVDAWHNEFWTVTQGELERFAALVAAAEREECAKVCEWEAAKLEQFPEVLAIAVCAAAIRARGEV